ncbi:hypothetical protein V498_09070 [Pseudogymnoascus sp. VKM F-4517 (FW-2822)]|nr:hypothetical protein V498_09070 [Pseudogymnoascus sp. VKM F-4517 (FW-2822)]
MQQTVTIFTLTPWPITIPSIPGEPYSYAPPISLPILSPTSAQHRTWRTPPSRTADTDRHDQQNPLSHAVLGRSPPALPGEECQDQTLTSLTSPQSSVDTGFAMSKQLTPISLSSCVLAVRSEELFVFIAKNGNIEIGSRRSERVETITHKRPGMGLVTPPAPTVWFKAGMGRRFLTLLTLLTTEFTPEHPMAIQRYYSTWYHYSKS